LATLYSDGRIERQRMKVAVSRLHEVEVNISGCTHQQQIRDLICSQVGDLTGFVRVTLSGDVAPDLDLRLPKLISDFPRLDGFQLRTGQVFVAYDTDSLKGEPTVRGQFVQDVLDSADLGEDERQKILAMGLRALEGREDLGITL